MKFAFTTLLIVISAIPYLAFARESFGNSQVQAIIEESGDWQLSDNAVGVTWHGQWINKRLMKVTGSDDSCFVLGQTEEGLVQLDCQNLKEISILLSYSG